MALVVSCFSSRLFLPLRLPLFVRVSVDQSSKIFDSARRFHPFVPVSLNSCPLLQVLDMSSTPTFRGTTSHRTVGRGRLPDFGGDSASHIPRPRHESSSTITSSQAPHTPGSDIGSSTMSAASSRQRQNQSKRDEVWKFPLKFPTRRNELGPLKGGQKISDSNHHVCTRLSEGSWRRTSTRRGTIQQERTAVVKLLPAPSLPLNRVPPSRSSPPLVFQRPRN